VRGQELSHPLSASQRIYPRKILAQDTVHVLAVMVQFQADNDSLTSGNGRFMLGEGSGLDAPPHNKSYFQNHLLFLKNYFRKVSGGNLNVAYTVLDSVVTLPHQMKYYSPPKSGGGNNMGLLFQDSWRIADSLYGSTFPFSQYQCFVIFHAGSGRDIDFTSVLGYDPLPYDIPSIYLSRQSLETMFGANYPGQVVENGRDAITNSIIMPESESYPILPLTLGTNGLLAASFGSFLGLPDLFDTQTGATGIGKFGLMDGQAIFAYGGIFPPEPSAWEKTYLGWVTPVEISPSTTTQYALYANETGKYSVLKVPISATEYFLLENRECDAHHDGEIVTSIYNDAVNTTEITFANDTAYFDGSQINKINGVVTDADEYDWALPQDTTYFGGILIWHIDESVIDQNLSTNTINANPAHRGVSLMEAHGANEIGNYIQSIFGAYYYDGSPYDFWYGGNPMRATPRKTGGNNFNPTTLPSSNGYNGANSHIYISNFSGHDSLMTFDVRVGESNFQPTPGFPKDIHSATTNSSPVFGHLTPDGKMQLVANNGSSLYAFNLDGTSAGFDSTGFFSKVGGRFQPVVSSSGASDTLYAMDDSVFYGLIDRDNNHDGTADVIFAAKDSNNFFDAGTPMLQVGNKLVVIDANSSRWSVFLSDGKYAGIFAVAVNASAGQGLAASTISAALSPYAVVDTTSYIYLKIGSNVIGFDLTTLPSTSASMPRHEGVTPPPIPIAISYAQLADKTSAGLMELTSGSVYSNVSGGKIFGAFSGDTITSGPVIADLNGDGSRDIIFATQTKVYAISYTGAVLNHFPISTVGSEILPSDANRIVGSMVVAKLTGDTADVIFGTKGGTLYAFNGVTGQMLNGFPISIGGGLAGSPAITYDSQSGNLYLAAIGLDGYLYSWTFKGNYSASSILWGNLLHDNSHTNSVTTALPAATIPPSITDTVSLMPKVYNWPNPVTTGTTKIRFYLRDNAQVSISIYSFAGQKVADMQANGLGGTANEVDWNVAGVQSGVYFARVEAVSSKTNQRSVAIIKIAVVK
jgi:hypothetical protein